MPQGKALGRFTEIPLESMSAEQREVADSFIRRRGAIPTPYRIFLSSPTLASRLKGLSDYVLRVGGLSQREIEICVLVTAQRLKSTFVTAAHRKIALDAGLSASAVDAILAGTTPDLSDDRERATYATAVAMFAGQATGEDFARATSTLGANGVCEAAAVIGFYCTCAFTLGFFEVQPAG